MKQCNPATEPTSLEWCTGQTNTPGIRPKVFFIPKGSIVKFPTLPTEIPTSGSMGDLATYVGSFKLVAEKKWKSMDILSDKSPATAESQGSKPSKTYLNQAVIVVPNADAESAGLSKLAANDDYVYLIQQRNGTYRVIGNEMFQTNTDVTLSLGSDPTGDEMGTTITPSCTDVCHFPIYMGEIVTEDGTINPDEQTGGA
ncbi:hypothetical protein [Dysgonomonas sp. HGC4]|uniref:hypothetical protein n=1 Tax=Dysgonomonas sp. HGC4 TaxID=1658009 RepID=UPI000681CAAB|nr:hypothetical protein [Dysgonomonas sp. HGC4]MBD8349360.1 hypothetical protein [Dysgonomonas sp. HGC4]